MRYGLNEKPPVSVTLLASAQWLIVTLSSTVVVPLVIGDVYGLDGAEVGRLMQQTIFFAGMTSLLQGIFGHRYPMMEGPAGLWWGIFVILAQIGSSIGLAPKEIGQSLEAGLMAAGVLFLILGATGSISRIQQWFTPAVTGTYMTLLAVSLSSAFIKGMLGIGFQQSSSVQPAVALTSLGIMALVFWFTRIEKIASFAVLMGMLAGWAAYAALGWAEVPRQTAQWVMWPSLFFWGPPRWDAGIVLTSVLTGFVLLTNLITSTVVVGRAVQAEAAPDRFNRGGVWTGVSHILSGLAGVVGMISLSLAAAVIATTRMAARLPFLIAMAAMMVIGVLPGVSQMLSAIPAPVAYAAMFAAYTQLVGFGLRDLTRLPLDERSITVIGSSLLIGIGVMFVPAAAWQSLHPLLSYLLGNGLLLGVLVALVMEHLVFPARRKQHETSGTAS